MKGEERRRLFSDADVWKNCADSELMELAQKLAFHIKRDVTGGLGDTYQSHRLGGGLEFEELRDYRYGDDARHIHWPSAGIPGRPLRLRQFREELDRNAVIVVDVSRSMICQKEKWLLAVETAVLLCGCASLFGKGAELLAFAGTCEGIWHLADGGMSPVLAAKVLFDVSGTLESFSVKNLAVFLACRLKKPSCIYIVSDFADEFVSEEIAGLCARHDVVLFQVWRSISEELERTECDEWEDSETGERCVVSLNSQTLRKAVELEDEWLTSVQHLAGASGAEYLLLDVSEDVCDTLRRWLDTCPRR